MSWVVGLSLLAVGAALLVAVMIALAKPREERWIVVHKDSEHLVRACYSEKEAELLRSQCGDSYIVRKVLR